MFGARWFARINGCARRQASRYGEVGIVWPQVSGASSTGRKLRAAFKMQSASDADLSYMLAELYHRLQRASYTTNHDYLGTVGAGLWFDGRRDDGRYVEVTARAQRELAELRRLGMSIAGADQRRA